MDKNCPVAAFIRRKLEITNKTQCEIAREVGFDMPNMITMIKQGKTKLPLAKVGRIAKALDTDPVFLMKLCMSTYHRDKWPFIEPMFETALTKDEASLLGAWRGLVGAPSLAAPSAESETLLHNFLLSLSNARVSQ